MKISIIGGGPAGLYFASAIKGLNPAYDVSIYEIRNESVNSFGLGYTLQKLGTDLLELIDPHYFEGLFSVESTPLITKALFRTHNQSKRTDFSEGYSVTRTNLMRYLRENALSKGVTITEQKITPNRLNQLQVASDLLIGADGINSAVRKHYSGKLKTKVKTAKLKFSWFINEAPQVKTEACFYAFQADEGVVMLTSYPLTSNKQVVIIEMTQNCLNKGKFKGKTPKQAVPYLNKILSSNGGLVDLQSANLPWYSFKMNTAENLHYNNVALLGDSAYSFHYSAGQGVTMAFTMAYTLAHCLHKNADIKSGLNHYNQTVQLYMKKPLDVSFSVIQWLENIDQHFQSEKEGDLLRLFMQKHQFDRVEFPNTKVG